MEKTGVNTLTLSADENRVANQLAATYKQRGTSFTRESLFTKAKEVVAKGVTDISARPGKAATSASPKAEKKNMYAHLPSVKGEDGYEWVNAGNAQREEGLAQLWRYVGYREQGYSGDNQKNLDPAVKKIIEGYTGSVGNLDAMFSGGGGGEAETPWVEVKAPSHRAPSADGVWVPKEFADYMSSVGVESKDFSSSANGGTSGFQTFQNGKPLGGALTWTNTGADWLEQAMPSLILGMATAGTGLAGNIGSAFGASGNVATGLGNAVISAGSTALQGGDLSQVLKSAGISAVGSAAAGAAGSAGLSKPVATAVGSAASGLASGKSLEDVLLGSLVSAGTSGLTGLAGISNPMLANLAKTLLTSAVRSKVAPQVKTIRPVKRGS